MFLFPRRQTAEEAFARSEVHHKHEADELRLRAQRQRMVDSLCYGTPDFIHYPGHRCVLNECRFVTAPANERVYECPAPMEHPPHTRNPDGSVLHKWSHVVSVCITYGLPHICTPSMCSHQTSCDGEKTCTLTGRSHGSELVACTELPFSFFESDKPMTAAHTQDVDLDAVRGRVAGYLLSKPENRDRERDRATAAKDAQQMQQRGVAAHAVDFRAGMLLDNDVTRSAGPIGLLPSPPDAAAQRLTITERFAKGPGRLAQPIIVPAPPNARARPVSETQLFSVSGPGPTEVDIRYQFTHIVTRFWEELERAYDLSARQQELAAAEARVIRHFVDGRRTSRLNQSHRMPNTDAPLTPFPLNFGEINRVHTDETATAFEGMQMVRILAAHPDWQSGAVRRECTAELSRRMWKLWEAITRSPKFQNREEPHLFNRVAGAMLCMVIDGYSISVCMQRQNGRSFVSKRCAHQSDATSVAPCGHRDGIVRLVAPYPMVQQLLAPAGMRRRALHTVCGFILGDSNAVVGFLASLFENGLALDQVRAICVGPVNR